MKKQRPSKRTPSAKSAPAFFSAGELSRMQRLFDRGTSRGAKSRWGLPKNIVVTASAAKDETTRKLYAERDLVESELADLHDAKEAELIRGITYLRELDRLRTLMAAIRTALDNPPKRRR